MSLKVYMPFYRRNLKVALPIMLTQLGGGIVHLVDNIMVGHLGTHELAAVAFANSIFVIGSVFAMGSTMGITPLIGHVFVRGDHGKVAQLLHNGIAFTILLGIIMTILLGGCYFFLNDMGQETLVAELARPYYVTLVLSLLPYMFFCTFKQFLEGIGDTKTAMLITIIANVVNILLNYLLIFGKMGCPALGVMGAGVATLIARLLMPIMFVLMLKRNKLWWNYVSEFSRKVLSFREIWLVAKVGIPIGGHILLECAAFAISTIMIGWLGAVPLAGHQIAQNMSHLSFMLIIGVSSATTIRISHQLGVKNFYALRMAGRASTHLCFLINICMALMMILLRYPLAGIFTKDQMVIEVGAQLLILAGLFQLSDGLQAVGAGVLRGITDVKVPMYYAFFAYICINIPLGYFLAFKCDLGAQGIWIAFIVGLTVAAFLFHHRIHKQIARLENAAKLHKDSF